MSFKVGQIVEAVNSIGTEVPAGAKGIVVNKYKTSGDYFCEVHWRDTRVSRVCGVYFVWRFKLAIKIGEQGVFSFMDEGE